MSTHMPRGDDTSRALANEQRQYVYNRRGRRLFVAVHGQPAKTEALWLFCNPFFEENTFCRRIYVSLARAVERTGMAAVRFDYEGEGNSEGDTEDVSPDDWVEDALDVAAWVQRRFSAVMHGVFAVRAGALVAAAAARRLGLQRLLAWAPVLDGDRFVHDCLRAHLTTQLASYGRVVETREMLMNRLQRGETVDLLGHSVSELFVSRMARLNLDREIVGSVPHMDLVNLTGIGADTKGWPAPWARLEGVAAFHRCAGPLVWQETPIHVEAPQELFRLTLELMRRPLVESGAP